MSDGPFQISLPVLSLFHCSIYNRQWGPESKKANQKSTGKTKLLSHKIITHLKSTKVLARNSLCPYTHFYFPSCDTGLWTLTANSSTIRYNLKHEFSHRSLHYHCKKQNGTPECFWCYINNPVRKPHIDLVLKGKFES